MGKCLVTRLKEVVTDSSLLRLGEKTFVLLPKGQVVIRAHEDMPIRVIGNGSFYIGSNTNALTEGAILQTGGYHTITNAQDYAIVLGMNNLSQLNVFSTGDSGDNQQIEIDLSFFEYSHKMTELTLRAEKIVGGTLKDMSRIAETSSLGAFYMSKCIGVVGSILDVAEVNYSAAAFPNFAFCSEVTGEIVDFVKAQRAKGRTSANVSAAYYVESTKITFNGTLATSIDESLPKAISWTATTITLGSVTINA